MTEKPKGVDVSLVLLFFELYRSRKYMFHELKLIYLLWGYWWFDYVVDSVGRAKYIFFLWEDPWIIGCLFVGNESIYWRMIPGSKVTCNSIYREYLIKGKQQVDYIKLENNKGIIRNSINEKGWLQSLSCKKMIHPATSSKTYWSILKTFYNGRKVPIIPPSLINDSWKLAFN